MARFRGLLCGLCVAVSTSAAAGEVPAPAEVEAAMRRATGFMYDTVAYRDGFVWLYPLPELEPYGELKARPSMIWVEPPGTPSVGIMLLEAYRLTGDAWYLERAEATAATLVAGQHPAGGWNYFIDFDPDGLADYYAQFFSKCWGWQEYLKQRTNATFDDYTTTEATRFLLRLHALTKEARHEVALRRALQFILDAQYEHGGWPQRFPLDDDYTAACTFNDDVALDCILVLLEAQQRLSENHYGEAARSGMDFYLRAQLPPPQAGWAQQYDPLTLQPVWGRPFEINTISAVQTHTNILDLFRFYKLTGDAQYLKAVPAALDWLEASRLPEAEGFTHTCFYEMGTNRPVYIRQTGTTVDDVKYTLTYEEEGCYPYAHRVTIPVDYLREEHARLSGLEPEAARRELEQESQSLPEHIRGHYLALALQKTSQTPSGISAIIADMDEKGGWRDEVSLLDPFQPFTQPPRRVTAYTTGGYIARMYRLINFLREHKEL